MRAILVLLGLAALVLVILMSLGMVSLDQTQSAQLPTIRVEGGQAPEFKADVGRIDVQTVNRTVEVPTLEVEKAEGAR
ncbi:hypothetical protein [Sphingomonas baiyangensis]|uniref:Uncharacterized protein n=1 Tax=Sphingomonas baiyangensis TaxID=2572576 RepID=A0A4U1L835_9SPHN|nr:hypothetical protein [Sphingomonas baiyangensis]TKD52934.1 hypothetical protein FBR43_00870 [Sphingomonas baiyangensis]